MAEKDVTEKLLEGKNDVFADIMNTLIFDGKVVIREDDLETISGISSYKMEGKIRSQERDVLKAWKQGCIRIAACGLENQTKVDLDIPLRVISYDGAVYRAQLNEKGKKRYPVITLVLYFGKGKWNGPKNLLERISVPKELEGLVSDYRINIFEIGQLSEEKLKQFNSDFQIVADYVIQMQKGETYKPSDKPIRHLEEVMDLMEALTNDDKYKEVLPVLRKIKVKGGKPTMRSAMDEAVKSAVKSAEARTETRMRSAMDEAVKSAEARTETRMRSAMDEAVKSAVKSAEARTETRMRSAMDEAVKSAEARTETRMRITMARSMILKGKYTKEEIEQITNLSQSQIEELEKEVMEKD